MAPQDPRMRQMQGMQPQGTAMPGGMPVGLAGMPPQRMGMTGAPRMAPPWQQAPAATQAPATAPAATQPPAATQGTTIQSSGGAPPLQGGASGAINMQHDDRMPPPWQAGATARPTYSGQAPTPGTRAQMTRPQQPGDPMQMRQQRQADLNRQQGGNAF